MASIGAWILPALVALTILVAWRRGVPMYDEFVDGAAEGLRLGLRLIPLIIGIYIAIGLFRESGALDWLGRAAAPVLAHAGFPPEILPLMIIRPFSNAAAMGVIAELLAEHGPDSFIGLLASIMQGSSETTFYVATLYLGSAGVRRPLHTVHLCLLGDLIGYVAALWITSSLA
ncbi:MAG: spore maturation protein [Firmicutes bacterium]|nr:spore maturation protein [Bacillota bacterium]